MIRLKRAYDEPSKQDGMRILVERLWPRGVSKEKAAVDLWLKDLAPSTELRKWYGHDPEKWDEFRKRYWSELGEKGDLLMLLKHLSGLQRHLLKLCRKHWAKQDGVRMMWIFSR